MSRRSQRNHSPAFKSKVALAKVKVEQTSSVFEQGVNKEPSVDIKTLHAKIGELTLENDFLEGALTKA